MAKSADHLDQEGDVFDAASAWFGMLQRGGVSDDQLQAFQDWIVADPSHETAFQHVKESWTMVGAAAASPELMELRQAALSDARRTASLRWLKRPWSAGVAAAAACMIAVIALSTLVLQPSQTQPEAPLVYLTETGETLVVTLDDSSKVSLDAETELTVDYSSSARRIQLLAGQAYFEVSKDPARPFIVNIGDSSVQALGTSFNIDTHGATTVVTLIEGRVAVNPDQIANAAPLQTMDAGEQLTLQQDQVVRRETVGNTKKYTSWRQGKLIFEGEALGSVIEKMNRYAPTSIGIRDAGTSELLISGVFDVGDTSAFINALELYFGVEAYMDPTTNQIVLAQSVRN